MAQDEAVAAREAAEKERRQLEEEEAELKEIAEGRLIHKPTPYAWGDTVYTPIEERSLDLMDQRKRNLSRLRDRIDEVVRTPAPHHTTPDHTSHRNPRTPPSLTRHTG